MSDIKIPSGPYSLEPQLTGVDASSPGVEDVATEALREPLATQAAEAAEPLAESTSAAGVEGAEPLQALVEEVRVGGVTGEQALAQLVEAALQDVQGALSAEQQEELRGLLRSALQSDPILRDLRNDLE